MANLSDNLGKILKPMLISGGGITTTGSGATFTVAACNGLIRTANSATAPLREFDCPEKTAIAIADGTTRYVIVDSVDSDADVEPSIRTATSDDSNGYSSFVIAIVSRSGSSQTINYPARTSKKLKVALTQSSSDAPTGVIRSSDFPAVGLTFARSSQGVYTVTAGSAIFTSGKTYTYTSDVQNGLHSFKVVVTSTTVLTVTTGLLTSGAATATDGILSNTMLEVEVFE